jgi:hypothetical protein
MGLTLNAAAFRAWTQLCAAALSSARSEIDALNVFPVPDSDTGTNAYLTFMSGTGKTLSASISDRADDSAAAHSCVHARKAAALRVRPMVRGYRSGPPPRGTRRPDSRQHRLVGYP